MKRSVLLSLFAALVFSASSALAGGAPAAKGPKFDWKASSMQQAATDFVNLVAEGKFAEAYKAGGENLRTHRTLEEFTQDAQRMGLANKGTIEWSNGIPALPANNGYKVSGTFKLADGSLEFPVYLHLEGDAHVDALKRNRKWTTQSQWTVLDYRSSRGMLSRIQMGDANGLDWFLIIFSGLLLIALLGMVWNYIKGLRGSPRELYLMFFTKLTEYSAYGAASVILVRYLSQDVLLNGQPLGDTDAYLFYGVWTLAATLITITVGSVCDTIGVKKCLLIGAVCLLTSRFIMPFADDFVVVAIGGFLPLAFGFAITSPVLKVGIKRFTSLKTATLGFGLFYTLMNVGFWIGAEIADAMRSQFADTGTLNFLGAEMLEMTTYQAIIAIGFLINIPDFIAILIMRDGAEMTENGFVINKKGGDALDVAIQKLKNSVADRKTIMKSELFKSVSAVAIMAALAWGMIAIEVHTWKISVIPIGRYFWALFVVLALIALGGVFYAGSSLVGTMSPGSVFDRTMKAVREATQGTWEQLKDNFTQRPFWVYMGMLAILVFVRLTFYIFHVMFPTYAMRVFGSDFPVASIFGSLNPAMIVFLVPLISILTVKVRSYTMLLAGTLVSAASVFLCFLPDSVALGLGDTWFGTWVLDYWLEAPEGNRDPFIISLIVFIMVFTVGEAMWSPRLMQFSAEIAPRGKEGAYIALAMLPYFLGKMGATIVSEQLTTRYFSADLVSFPDHTTSWLVIGIMAMISPIGLVIFRKTFSRREDEARAEALEYAAEQKALAEGGADASSEA